MSLRIGDWILYPNAAILPFALLFFIALSLRQLRRAAVPRAAVVVAVAAAFGFAGALAYGLATAPERAAGSTLLFGSWGGYWGAFLGAAAVAFTRRDSVLRYAGALVPGVAAGGGVARLGCIFAGCCQGTGLLPGPWPAYDLGALAIAGLWAGRKPEAALTRFLLLYGLLRFALESARDQPAVLGPLTTGHAAALVQIAVAAGAAAIGQRHGRAV